MNESMNRVNRADIWRSYDITVLSALPYHVTRLWHCARRVTYDEVYIEVSIVICIHIMYSYRFLMII
jgi:hypothetical protein